jgi:hypothetical protein
MSQDLEVFGIFFLTHKVLCVGLGQMRGQMVYQSQRQANALLKHLLTDQHRLVRHVHLQVLGKVQALGEISRGRQDEDSRQVDIIKQLQGTNLRSNQILTALVTQLDNRKSLKVKLSFDLRDYLFETLSDSLPVLKSAMHWLPLVQGLGWRVTLFEVDFVDVWNLLVFALLVVFFRSAISSIALLALDFFQVAEAIVDRLRLAGGAFVRAELGAVTFIRHRRVCLLELTTAAGNSRRIHSLALHVGT